MNEIQSVKYIEIDADFAGFILHGPQLTCTTKPDFVGELIESASWAKHIRVDHTTPRCVRVEFVPRSTFLHSPSERQEVLFRQSVNRALTFFGTTLNLVSQDRKVKSTPNMYL